MQEIGQFLAGGAVRLRRLRSRFEFAAVIFGDVHETLPLSVRFQDHAKTSVIPTVLYVVS
jgi:hypothetical protein